MEPRPGLEPGTCAIALLPSFAFLPLLSIRLKDSRPSLRGILRYNLWKTFPPNMISQGKIEISNANPLIINRTLALIWHPTCSIVYEI